MSQAIHSNLPVFLLAWVVGAHRIIFIYLAVVCFIHSLSVVALHFTMWKDSLLPAIYLARQTLLLFASFTLVSSPKNTQFTPRDGQSRGGDFVNQATTLRFPQSQADATNNIHSSAGLYYSTICKCSPTSKTGIVTDVDGLLVRAN